MVGKLKKPPGRPRKEWPPELDLRATVDHARRNPGSFFKWTAYGVIGGGPKRESKIYNVDYRHAAQEYLKWYREDCRRKGRKYVRLEAIDQAVKLFQLDRRNFITWLDRSKRASRRP